MIGNSSVFLPSITTQFYEAKKGGAAESCPSCTHVSGDFCHIFVDARQLVLKHGHVILCRHHILSSGQVLVQTYRGRLSLQRASRHANTKSSLAKLLLTVRLKLATCAKSKLTPVETLAMTSPSNWCKCWPQHFYAQSAKDLTSCQVSALSQDVGLLSFCRMLKTSIDCVACDCGSLSMEVKPTARPDLPFQKKMSSC